MMITEETDDKPYSMIYRPVSCFFFYIRYRKRSGKDGLMAQAAWSTQPVRGSARRGSKEHQETAPSRCSLPGSPRLQRFFCPVVAGNQRGIAAAHQLMRGGF